MTRRRRTLAERLWSKVDRHGGPLVDGAPSRCSDWTGARLPKGYGRISIQLSPGRQSTRVAHRVAYELEVGPIPEGLQLDHLCDREPCIEPEHLDPCTDAENERRKGGPHFHLRGIDTSDLDAPPIDEWDDVYF